MSSGGEGGAAERLSLDVVVIGGGPAGSTLAALLAGKGLDVALVDRDPMPRDKLCGEFLSYDAMPVLERLGADREIDGAGSPRIERCRVVGSRRTYEFTFPHPARGVSRLLLDELLFRTAVGRGARRFDGWMATKMEEGRVTIERGDERLLLEAAAVAGAWGRWGRFDQQLGRAFVRDRSRRNFGFKRHYRPAAHVEAGIIDLYSFKRGYLGVNGIEGGLTNICGLVHASRLAGHKGRWDAFVEEIRQEEPQLERLYAAHQPAQEQFLSSEPVIFRARSPVEHGVFMVGDASGVIDPLTGNGMAMAIQSALLVAPMLLRIARSPAGRATMERQYRGEHARMFDRRIAWSRRTARLLSRPKLLDLALTAGGLAGGAGPFLLRHTRTTREAIERMADAWF
jgi:flavin-dependent dehydrogenase